MIGILVTGPNCSGKTTAVKRALEPWTGDSRVLVVLADTQCNKMDPAVLQGYFEGLWTSTLPVIVVEGTDRAARALGRSLRANRSRRTEVHVMVRLRSVMFEALKARCESRGKTFNAPYWDAKKLEYEGQKRYPNLVRSFGLPMGAAKSWEIGPDYVGQDRLITAIQTRITEALNAV